MEKFSVSVSAHALKRGLKARPQPLNNLLGGGGGGQIGVDEYTSKNLKNVDFDCNINAFFGTQ